MIDNLVDWCIKESHYENKIYINGFLIKTARRFPPYNIYISDLCDSEHVGDVVIYNRVISSHEWFLLTSIVNQTEADLVA